MSTTSSMKVFAQMQRELQEYRNSLIISPAVIAGLLILLMLGSVLLVGRVSIVGDGVMKVLMHEHGDDGVSVHININDDTPRDPLVVIEEEGPVVEEDWNFSREWTFSPGDEGKIATEIGEEVHSLNPMLNILHALFLVIMLLLSINYLLSALYDDRKDRSILFWKSLPVSEWHEVMCKLAVASLVVPLVFLVASMLTQLAYVVLAMLLTWRMDADPTGLILNKIEFVPLFLNQIGGLLIWIAWTLPLYAWFLLCSSAAKRSPFLWAFGIPLTLIFIEKFFIGSDYLDVAISNHVPHLQGDNDSASMGMYVNGPVWTNIDYLGMLLGWGVAAAFLGGAVWMRRHRFDI
jgi:ABC-2 type transport system permease protein